MRERESEQEEWKDKNVGGKSIKKTDDKGGGKTDKRKRKEERGEMKAGRTRGTREKEA